MLSRIRAALLCLFLASPAFAAPAEPAWLRDGSLAFQQLLGDQAADFEAMDQAFIDARARAPDDVALAIAHCDLFWLVWDLEGAAWSEVAPDRHGNCLASLEERMPDAPEVQLLLAERDGNEDRERAALALWETAGDWPAPLRLRLAKVLADAEYLGDESSRFKLEAARLGDPSSLHEVINDLASRQGADAAIELAAGAPLATTRWQLDKRLESLSALGQPNAAHDHLIKHADAAVTPSWNVLADVLIEAGETEALAERLRLSKDPADETRPAAFALAVARGDAALALTHFELDFEAFDRTGREYFQIIALGPWWAFAPTLLPFTFVLVLIGAVMALATLLMLAPVHYRGLARRLAGRAPEPLLPGLGLPHAWYGVAIALLLLPTLVLGIVQPQVMGELFAGNESAAETLTVMLWSTLASLLALLPTLYWLRRPQWTVAGGEWPGMAGRVVGAYLLGYAISLACSWVAGLMASSGVDVPSSTFQGSLLDEGLARYGFLVTLLVVGVLVPIVEEWIFRGLLLAGLARHLHFAWANLAQASLFMLVHDDSVRFPFFLALGLLAGWLVKRYRSLLPAVLLHVANNIIAVVLLT